MCIFSKRRYEEWKYTLLKEKGDFVLELVVSEWEKNKEQNNMTTGSCKRFVEKEHWEKRVLCMVKIF